MASRSEARFVVGSTGTLGTIAIQTTMVVLSAGVAFVLFGVLDSTGAGEIFGMRIGGALVGFAVCFLLLLQLYKPIAAKNEEIDELTRANARLKGELDRFAGPSRDRHCGDSTIDDVLDSLRLEHQRFGRLLPPSTLLKQLRRLFKRHSFDELTAACGRKAWGSRLRAALLTERVLRDYEEIVESVASPEQADAYNDLLRAIHAYTEDLTAFFSPRLSRERADALAEKKEEFDDYTAGAIDDDEELRIPYRRCDGHLRAISVAWIQLRERAPLLHLQSPPVLGEEALDYARLGYGREELQKDLIRSLETRIEKMDPFDSEERVRRAAASGWDLDRIAAYIHPRFHSQGDPRRNVDDEFNRIQSKREWQSARPLYYAIETVAKTSEPQDLSAADRELYQRILKWLSEDEEKIRGRIHQLLPPGTVGPER